MDLSKCRDALIAEHRAMEKYDPHWKAEAERGRKISDRPIAFLCDDEIVVLGQCVGKVFDGMQRFVEEKGPLFDDPEIACGLENYKRHAYAKAKKLLGQFSSVPEELRLHQQTWNAVGFCLNEMGIDVVLTQGSKS